MLWQATQLARTIRRPSSQRARSIGPRRSSGQAGGCRTGLVTEAITQDWKNLEGFRAYLCGAPPMVEATSLLVRQMGVLPEQIYADAFYASGT